MTAQEAGDLLRRSGWVVAEDESHCERWARQDSRGAINLFVWKKNPKSVLFSQAFAAVDGLGLPALSVRRVS